MKYTADQFNKANNLRFKVSFSCYDKVHTTSYGTGIEFVLSELSSFVQDSVTKGSMFKMFVAEGRKKHMILYLDEVTNTASSGEIIIEIVED